MIKNDIVGHDQIAAPLMPTRAVPDQRRDRAGGNLTADLLEVRVHALGIGGGSDEGRTDAANQSASR